VKRLAVIGVLAALAAAGSGVGLSSAAFTATSQSTATIGAATDWLAPGVSVSSPADGARLRSGSVTAFGAAGSDDGDSSTVSVSLYSGGEATGSPVLTRTASRVGGYWYATLTPLADGTYTLLATQSDDGGNTGRATRTFTVDTTAPTRVSLKAENGSGSSGHLDAGDTITFTYSDGMLPSSILSGWTGASAATVSVRFSSGSPDSFTVLDGNGNANVKLDSGVTLGSNADYVTNTVTFAASLTQSDDGKSFVVTLGSPDRASRIVATQVSQKNMTWTPKSGPTDMAGNALASTATWTETDNDRDF
jgi:Bacterial Ig-like domain